MDAYIVSFTILDSKIDIHIVKEGHEPSKLTHISIIYTYNR